MGNSRRWGRLMEWIRHLQDTNKDITLKDLAEKVNRIKDGAVLYDAEVVERAVDQAFIVRDKELRDILDYIEKNMEYLSKGRKSDEAINNFMDTVRSDILNLFKKRESELLKAVKDFRLWYMTLAHYNPDSAAVLHTIIPDSLINQMAQAIAKADTDDYYSLEEGGSGTKDKRSEKQRETLEELANKIYVATVEGNLGGSDKYIDQALTKITDLSNKRTLELIDPIIEEIQQEINSRPQYPNIGKKGCLKRLAQLRQKVEKGAGKWEQE